MIQYLTLALTCLLPACASAPVVRGSSLSSYEGLTPSDGVITKSLVQVDRNEVLAARTVSIAPATFSTDASPKLSQQQRKLVANTIDRTLCVNLSDRFEIVAPDTPADLRIRTTVTQVIETDEVAAGLSAAISIGTKVVDFGVPVPVPRIPIGLGTLSIEAEAVGNSGKQQAAMLWARGATALFSSPKASKVSDAYDLAAAFSEDFSYLLLKGVSPFGTANPQLPSQQRFNSAMGLSPKYKACERYGRYPGVAGALGGAIGLPPEWTDSGAQKQSD